jgi:RHS repeat-associated protein
MIHNDHLATPQKMTDSTGAVVWAADYKPFGEATINPSSTIPNNLRFSGQYFDAETGLNYNLRRDYNTAIGKYIEADPLNLGTVKILFPEIADKLTEYYKTNPGSQKLHVYVQNAPTRYSDPLGLLGWDTVIKFLIKQLGKQVGKKLGDDGDITLGGEGDSDGDGVPDFIDPDDPGNQPCIACHTGPRLPIGPRCEPRR